MQNCRKLKFSWFKLTMMLMVGYFLYICTNQQLELYAIQQETRAAQGKLNQATESKNNLESEKEKLCTATYVERVARDELGLVKPGEVPFISKNDKKQ